MKTKNELEMLFQIDELKSRIEILENRLRKFESRKTSEDIWREYFNGRTEP